MRGMRIIADLHLHSKYSRATSRDLDVHTNAQWAKWKGIDVVGTADITHPIWLQELRDQLEEDPEHPGLFRIKDKEYRQHVGGDQSPLFILSVETSHIYKQSGHTHRIHLVTFAPSLEVAEQIQQRLVEKKINISSDGRPIMGMSCPEYMDLVLNISDECMIVPAHVWTPWYSLYGSMSGFDSITECFQEFTPFVYAIETGLSSDPSMNWQISELDDRAIISSSDAHSPSKLGREATVFDCELSYQGLMNAIKKSAPMISDDVEKEGKIISTIEFYPEEGKYHYDGHRNCGVCQSPQETKQNKGQCPVCGRELTLGVMYRVQKLASRKITHEQLNFTTDEYGVKWVGTPKGLKPPYCMLVPLSEIIAEVYEVGVGTKTVKNKYDQLVQSYESEFKVLLETKVEDIERDYDNKLAEAIQRVRSGNLQIDPGYDGEFGKVKIFSETEKPQVEASQPQEKLF